MVFVYRAEISRDGNFWFSNLMIRRAINPELFAFEVNIKLKKRKIWAHPSVEVTHVHWLWFPYECVLLWKLHGNIKQFVFGLLFFSSSIIRAVIFACCSYIAFFLPLLLRPKKPGEDYRKQLLPTAVRQKRKRLPDPWTCLLFLYPCSLFLLANLWCILNDYRMAQRVRSNFSFTLFLYSSWKPSVPSTQAFHLPYFLAKFTFCLVKPWSFVHRSLLKIQISNIQITKRKM